jgi:hypothetical protein
MYKTRLLSTEVDKILKMLSIENEHNTQITRICFNRLIVRSITVNNRKFT